MRILLFLFCLSTGLAFGQKQGTLFGKVTDQDGKPVIGASVIYKKDFTQGAVTDLEGNYQLKLPEGRQPIICRYTNMITDTVTVTIVADKFVEQNISLKPYDDIKQFEALQVTAGKFDKPIEESTISLAIIKPDEIENTNTRKITGVLDKTPGLNILDGEPQIRGGSGFTFGVGSKVTVFVDDMPMLSGDAGRPLWDFIPLENIKQIEVIKGAGSVLSGAAALSGAIRIRTKYPTDKPLTKVNVYSGMYSYPEDKSAIWQKSHPSLIEGANFIHSRKIGNWDLTFGGDLNYDEGYMGPPILDPYIAQSFPDTLSNFTNKQMRTKKARVNFAVRHRSKKFKGLAYGLNGNGMISQSPMVFAWLNDTSGLYRGYPGATFIQTQTMFNLDPYLQLNLASGGQHKLRGRFLYTNNDITANQSNNTKLYYIDYEFKRNYKKLGGLNFIGGLTYSYVDTYAEMYEGSGAPENYLEHVSAYAQLEKEFWKIINLSVGGRLEYFSLNHGKDNQLKPIFRAGGSIKLAQASFLRMSYGQGFRYPTITERFIQTGVGNFGVFPNPDLQPETSSNSEIGVRQGFKFGPIKGYLDVAGFWQQYKNTIEYLFGFWDLNAPNGLGAGFKFLNTGESRVIGIDASVQGKAKINDKNDITFMVGYNYILPKTLNPDLVYAIDEHPGGAKHYTYMNTSLNPDRHILKYRFIHNIKGDIAWQMKNRVAIGLSVKYFSKMVNMDGVIADFEHATHVVGTIQNIMYMDYFHKHNKGIWVLDARVNYSFSKRHKLSFVVKNFMNKSYSLRPLKIEAPRSFVLQYTLTLH